MTLLAHWHLVRRSLGLASAFAAMLTGPAVVRAAEAKVDFNRDIRPILSDNCFACHGPDAKQRKAKLRLDTRDGALAKLRGGDHAIVPGKIEESTLIERISSDDPGQRMPPAKTGKHLTAQQIELFRRWIAQGAPYAVHWSFVPPSKPDLPTPPLSPPRTGGIRGGGRAIRSIISFWPGWKPPGCSRRPRRIGRRSSAG